METNLYNKAGEKSGTVNLPDGVFGLKWNPALVYQVVTGQEANSRKKVAHVKDRSEVRGGGKKPWRQKGTGRARHGSTRSPIWKGGGVTHGPNAETNFKKKINKKMARKALYTVLSAKRKDNELIIVEDLGFSEAKTKYAAQLFRNLMKDFGKINKGNGVLVALAGKDHETKRAIRNIPYAEINEARNLTALETLRHKYILIPKEAIEVFK